MLQPKRSKFRKMHKGRIRGEAKGGSTLNFGTYGLKPIEPERITFTYSLKCSSAVDRSSNGPYMVPSRVC